MSMHAECRSSLGQHCSYYACFIIGYLFSLVVSSFYVKVCLFTVQLISFSNESLPLSCIFDILHLTMF